MDPRKSVRIKAPQDTSRDLQGNLQVHPFKTNSVGRNSIVTYSLRPVEVLRRRLSLSKLKNACVSTPRRKSSKPRSVIAQEKDKLKLSSEMVRVRRMSEGNLSQVNKVIGHQEPYDYCQSERQISDVKPTVRQLQNQPIGSLDSVSPRGILKHVEPKKLSLSAQKAGSNIEHEKSSTEINFKSEFNDSVPQAVGGTPYNLTRGADCVQDTPASSYGSCRSRTRSLNSLERTFSVENTPLTANTEFPGARVDFDCAREVESDGSFEAIPTATDLGKAVKIFAQVKGEMIPLRINNMNKDVLIQSIKAATKKQGAGIRADTTSAISDSSFVIVKRCGTATQENRSTISMKKSVSTRGPSISSFAGKTLNSTKIKKPQEKFGKSKWALNPVPLSKEFKEPAVSHRYRRHTLSSAAKVKLIRNSLSSGSVSIVNTPLPEFGLTDKSKVPKVKTHPKRFQLF